MPKGTKVEHVYKKLESKMPHGKTAAIAQKLSGQSLKTGKPLTQKKKGK